MARERSRLAIGLRYLGTYLVVSLVGMIIYAGVRGKPEVLLFMPLIPMLFPHGLAIVAGCYDVHLTPLHLAVAFGPYTITAVLGIWTKRTVFFVVFVGLLLVNIGGCVWTGLEDAKTDRLHSNNEVEAIRL